MKYDYCKLGYNYWLYACNYYDMNGNLIPAIDRAIKGEMPEAFFRRKKDLLQYITENGMELINRG